MNVILLPQKSFLVNFYNELKTKSSKEKTTIVIACVNEILKRHVKMCNDEN